MPLHTNTLDNIIKQHI